MTETELGSPREAEVLRPEARPLPYAQLDEQQQAALERVVGLFTTAVHAAPIVTSDNLLIGDLGDLAGHPLWRLNSPVPGDVGPRLALTVGSDDPLVFNSRLPMEYQLLYDTLVLAGLSDSEALRWLDGVRRTGLERRFTTPAVAIGERWMDMENLAPLDPPLI